MYTGKHALQRDIQQRVHLNWTYTCVCQLGHKITETAIRLTRLQESRASSCSGHCFGPTSLAVCLENWWLRELLFQEFADVSRVSNLLAIEL